MGVEPIPLAVLTRIRTCLPGLCLLNGYGPTETTICSTLFEVTPTSAQSENSPIGRPVANTQIYLLDSWRQPVPMGVVGEIYIGGVGLARGYLNRAELTAERFVPDPFNPQPGARLYRTGDLARYLPDGNLEFLGRIDDQIKIHGVRIEPGEIETYLTQHPKVHQAAVLARPDPEGEKRLVAYVIPTHGQSLSPGELRQYLAHKLPRSLVPSIFVMMDALPLTPGGKLDRQALPPPDPIQTHKPKSSSLALSSAEQVLATVWKQVLGVEQVRAEDNFFELGGDSILGLQICALAAQSGLHVTPRQLFQAPTLAGLAAIVENSELPSNHSDEFPLEGSALLTPIQRWFFERNFPDANHWNHAWMGITPKPLDPTCLSQAVAALLAHHDALRLHFIRTQNGWQQDYGRLDGEIPVEVIDLASVSEANWTKEIEAVAQARQSSLDLLHGPLVRLTSFTFGPERAGRLLIVIHHLVCDGVSWRIILEDLQTAYHQFEQGLPVHLPSKTASYRDWAERLTHYAHSPEILQEAPFWLGLRRPDESIATLDRMTICQYPESLDTEATTERVSVSLTREETQVLLRELSVTERGGIDAVLLTALTRTIQRWTGSPTIQIDLEGHGREDIFYDLDFSRTVGWFTSLYPVRLDLPMDVGPVQALDMVREQLRSIPQHGLGYSLLRYLSPDPGIAGQLEAIPPAPVGFNYLGQFPQMAGSGFVGDLAQESVGQVRSPNASRLHLLEIDAAIVHSKLQIVWAYSRRAFTQEAVERAAGFFIAEMQSMIALNPSRWISGQISPSVPQTMRSQTQAEEFLPVRPGEVTGIPQRNVEDAYALSPMQAGMLFHSLSTPDSGVYFQQVSCTLQGALDVPAFERAWQRALDRHPILRSCFAWRGLDQMLQVVEKGVRLALNFQDLSALSPIEQQVRLDTRLENERALGFDLSRAPLLRLVLLQLTKNSYRFLMNYHHAVLDGWSLGLLFNDILAFYQADLHDQDIAIPSTRPYRDYIAWLERQDLIAAEAFWRKTFAGFVSPALQRTQSTPGNIPARILEKEVHLLALTTRLLQRFAREHQLTLSTLVQAAWALNLYRDAGQKEVCFGITVVNRPSELHGSATMIGLMINTLPIRVACVPEAPLVDWLQRLQDQIVGAQQYAYPSLAQIQHWSGASRKERLFDTLLVYENYPSWQSLDHEPGQLQIRDIHAYEHTNYPLAISISPGIQLAFKAYYDPAVYTPNRIEHLLGSWAALLERMISDPEQSLASLQDISQSEGIPPISRQSPIAPWVNPDTLHQNSTKLAGPPIEEMGKPPVEIDRDLEMHLAQMWEDVLQVEQVGADQDFFEMGGDSLNAAVLIHRLQQEIHENIGLGVIFDAPTIRKMAEYLERNHRDGLARMLGRPESGLSEGVVTTASPAVPSALVPIQPEGSRPPLFCIHPAGGVVFPYYTLAPLLGKDQPLYGIQDPALFDPQDRSKSIEAMATRYLEALKVIQPEGPYHLLGWSVGGVVAFEMAQQLTRQGQSVDHLILLDTRAPALDKALQAQSSFQEWLIQSADRTKALPANFHQAKKAVGPIVSYISSGLYFLATSKRRRRVMTGEKPAFKDLVGWTVMDAWRTYLLQEVDRFRLTSQNDRLLLIEMPDVRHVLQLVKEHIRLASRYTAAPYPGKLILIRAIPEKGSGPSGDPSMGWGKLTNQDVEIHLIPANHVALMVKPHVAVLAQQLIECLGQ